VSALRGVEAEEAAGASRRVARRAAVRRDARRERFTPKRSDRRLLQLTVVNPTWTNV